MLVLILGWALGQLPGAEPIRKETVFSLAKSAIPSVERLQRAGFAVEELREDVAVDVFDPVTQTSTPLWLQAGSFLVRGEQSRITQALEWDDSSLSTKQEVFRLAGTPILFSQPALPQGQLKQPPKQLTVDRMIRGDIPWSLDGNPNTDIEWVDSATLLMHKGGPLLLVDALTGRAKPIENRSKLRSALMNIPGVDFAAAEEIIRGPRMVDPHSRSFLAVFRNDLFFASLDGSQATQLTKTPAAEEQPTRSPDGKSVAFVRADNLYVVDVASKKETALTTDGGGPIRNGKADWVYWEEIYDRNARPFWWNPDSSQLLFLRFDDSKVSRFTVINDLPTRQQLEQTHYPKSGDPNPSVRIGVANVQTGKVRWIEPPLEGQEPTIVSRINWINAHEFYYTVQDRIQSYLDLYVCRVDGEPRKILREKTKAWVDYRTVPHFLKDGSFLLPSERNGWKHLYHYQADGTLVKQMTNGEWEIRRVDHVDEKTGWITFTATKDDPIAESLYRIKLDGTGMEKLNTPPGRKRKVSFSPSGRHFIEVWEDERTPAQVALREAGGPLVRTVDANPVHAQERLQMPETKYVQVPARDGYLLEGTLTLPINFDPKKKYPVWLKVYGGPQMPQVRRSFGGGRLADRALAQAGVIVFVCDPRSASGKGAASAWTAYRQLGVQENKDLSDAVAWLLKEHPYCDAQRVGIEGTSYGGYMTAYCMTHSNVFAAGIAAAAVTDWHNYDSFYTERYMDIPANNRQGYEVGSVVKAASNLHGKLLLIHGMMDDNVHPQNAMQLVHALQNVDKDFEMMAYPTARHGGFGRHYLRLRTEFIKRTLGGPK